jgi:hypothetical protein
MAMNKNLIDRRFRLPRIWSNQELRKFSELFDGEVINVSAWDDRDKEGGSYKEYFSKASGYFISNHPTLPKGYRQRDGEILLDLEETKIANELTGRFSVVLNHTVLEHVFDLNCAVDNLCKLSNDIVISIVPFMQQMHGSYDEGGYGDYWRFTPLCLRKLFKLRGFSTIYQSYNSHENASVYVINVCSKFPEKWKMKMPKSLPDKVNDKIIDGHPAFVGSNMIRV